MKIDYEDPDLSEFLAACAKQFCPWCGAPVVSNRLGRKKKFCSDKCRWAFWKFETRHKDVKLKMETRLNENSRTEGAAGHRTETGRVQPAQKAEAGR